MILPAFTFEATANVVMACSAKPVFADIQSDYTIDPEDVKRKITKRTKAIIPVHLYGYPVDLDEIREIAQAQLGQGHRGRGRVARRRVQGKADRQTPTTRAASASTRPR